MAYNLTHSGAQVDAAIDKVTNIIDLIYPIGSIYMSVNTTNPGTLFGGVWEKIQDRFLLAAGTTYASGTTGGSATMAHTHSVTAAGTVGGHTLTEAEMPKHDGHIHGQARPTASEVTNGVPTTSYYLLATANTSGSNYGFVINHGNEAYPATIKVGGGDSHNHEFTGSAVTSGAASNTSIIPPYLAVNIWKRIS